MQAGTVVVSKHTALFRLTGGKEYTVVEVIPRTPMENGFTFPEYWVVVDDFGDRTAFHTYRFKEKP
ncbi:hypothetical protein [Xanthomonas phage MUD8-T1]|uniref:Uncharacterized protein n=1 Tax=Xanthomonas phage MUD8-T1 TaxID=2886033 RepID=A0AAE8YNA1_9CAUD|nr:hypothetical protein [Xanthomonas phage MUD8-T1]UGL62999.1 hypothetical protein [Xanthomonas phage R3-22-T1]